MVKKIRKVLKVITMFAIIAFIVEGNKRYKMKLKKEQDYGKKMNSYYMLLNKWMLIKQQGKSLADYFHKKGIASVAIYGYKELGERVYDELKETDIDVKYIIDQNMYISTEIDKYSPDDELPLVDAVIVTVIYSFDEIEDALCENVDCPIISLEEVVNSVF